MKFYSRLMPTWQSHFSSSTLMARMQPWIHIRVDFYTPDPSLPFLTPLIQERSGNQTSNRLAACESLSRETITVSISCNWQYILTSHDKVMQGRVSIHVHTSDTICQVSAGIVEQGLLWSRRSNAKKILQHVPHKCPLAVNFDQL